MHPNIFFTTTFKLHNFSLWNGKMAEKPQNCQIIMVFSTILKKTFATEKKEKEKKDRGKYPL